MQIASFTYTKADGSVSNREVLVHSSDTAYLEGTDLSELSEDEKQDVIASVASVEEYGTPEQLAKALADAGLLWNYRKFKLDRATNLSIEFI